MRCLRFELAAIARDAIASLISCTHSLLSKVKACGATIETSLLPVEAVLSQLSNTAIIGTANDRLVNM